MMSDEEYETLKRKSIQLIDTINAAAADGDVEVLKQSFDEAKVLWPNSGDLIPGTTRDAFDIAVKNNRTEAADFLKGLIQEQALEALGTKASQVLLLTGYGMPEETAFKTLGIPAEEAPLVTTLMEAMRPVQRAMEEYMQATVPGMERDITLKLSKYGTTKKQRAVLKEYGLKSEGKLATALSFGFNKRSNARKLPQIQQDDEKMLAAKKDAITVASEQYGKAALALVPKL